MPCILFVTLFFWVSTVAAVAQPRPFKILYDSTSQLTLYWYEKTDTVKTSKGAKVAQTDWLCTYSPPQSNRQRLVGVDARFPFQGKTLRGLGNFPLMVQRSVFKPVIDTLEPTGERFSVQAGYNLTAVKDARYWKYFLLPISESEGGLFRGLNTYDQVGFSFGFLQLAANGDGRDSAFAQYLRRTLSTPKGRQVFPNLRVTTQPPGQFLEVTTDRMYKTAELLPRKGEGRPRPLRQYLNPDSLVIDEREVVNAARFVYLVDSDTTFRNLQVALGIQWAKQILTRIHQKSTQPDCAALNLNGQPIRVCMVLVDLIHHGRAELTDIHSILRQNIQTETQLIDSLLTLNKTALPSRRDTVERPRTRTLRKVLQNLPPDVARLTCVRKEDEWVFEARK
jgi:hypothetical protein